MAIFSQNQVRNFYIATALKNVSLTPADTAGTIRVNKSDTEFWFEYVTPNGNNGNTVVRTDLVPLANLKNLNHSTTGKTRKLKKLEVELEGNVQPGKDYILRFIIYLSGLGGVENQYVKDAGVYRAKTGDTATAVMAALKTSCEVNFSREAQEYVKVTTSGAKLVIEEVEQPWIKGKRKAAPLNFQVFAVPITYEDDPWGKITDVTADNTNTVGNGKMVADMEWFFLGERADQYREMGFPNNFVTNYLANPTSSYEFLNIDFFYAGNAEDVAKSPKTITIASATSSILTDIMDILVPPAPVTPPGTEGG